MSKLSEKIKRSERQSRKIRLVNSLLGAAVVIFVFSCVFLLTKIKDTNTKLAKSEQDVQNSYDSIAVITEALAKSDATLKAQNEKLLEAIGSIESYWTDALANNRIKHYANYLSKAMEGDEHYDEALKKMNDLAKKKGYVQVTESNGNKLLEKLENLDTEDDFYKALSDRSIRNGVLGNSDFSNQGRNGDALLTGDVVKVIRIIPSGNAQWAEIRYSN